MKIISLNIWGGRVHKPLLDFLVAHSDVDIFCLQEVYHDAVGKEIIYTDAMLNIYKDISEVLINYNGYYRPHLQDYYGLAIFIKKDIDLIEEGEYYVHRQKGYVPKGHVGFHAKNVQYVTIQSNNGIFNIINFHGLWTGEGKDDTDDRINQSKNIIKFVDSLKGGKIICGDFNLNPDTESVKILEGGMINLIKDKNITSTRTSLYKKPNRYADYVFVSPEIKVKNFEVLPQEISDHSPMLVEFIDS